MDPQLRRFIIRGGVIFIVIIVVSAAAFAVIQTVRGNERKNLLDHTVLKNKVSSGNNGGKVVYGLENVPRVTLLTAANTQSVEGLIETFAKSQPQGTYYTVDPHSIRTYFDNNDKNVYLELTFVSNTGDKYSLKGRYISPTATVPSVITNTATGKQFTVDYE